MNTQRMLLFCFLASGQLQAMTPDTDGWGRRDSDRRNTVLEGLVVVGAIGLGLLGIYSLSQLDWSGDEANRQRIANLSREELLAMLQKYATLKKSLDRVRDSSQDMRAEAAFVAAGHSISDWRDAQIIVRYTEAFDAIGESVRNSNDACRVLYRYIRDLKALESNPYFSDATLKSIGISKTWVNELRLAFDKDLSVLDAIWLKKMEKEWADAAAEAAKERDLATIREAADLAREQRRELRRAPVSNHAGVYCAVTEDEAALRARMMSLSAQYVCDLVQKYDAVWSLVSQLRANPINLAYTTAFAQAGYLLPHGQTAYCLLHSAVRELEALKFNPYCTDYYLISIQYSRNRLDQLIQYFRGDLEYWYRYWQGQ